jgi:hypothetical protein
MKTENDDEKLMVAMSEILNEFKPLYILKNEVEHHRHMCRWYMSFMLFFTLAVVMSSVLAGYFVVSSSFTGFILFMSVCTVSMILSDASYTLYVCEMREYVKKLRMLDIFDRKVNNVGYWIDMRERLKVKINDMFNEKIAGKTENK